MNSTRLPPVHSLSRRPLGLASGLALGLAVVLCLPDSLTAQRGGRRGGQAGATWAHDGQHVVYEGAWYDPLTWEKVQPVPQSERDLEPPRDKMRAAIERGRGAAISEASMVGERRGGTLPRQPVANPGAKVSADGTRGAAVLDGELWVWRDGEAARQVFDGLGGIRRFEMAPDGSAVSYLKEQDLYLTRTSDGSTVRVTDDGGEDIFNGELDWVYQEEVYGRGNFKGTWWSENSRHLAYLRIDERGVDTFTVVDHIPDQLELDTIKYPKSGRTNPRATLHVVRASDGGKVAINLDKYPAEDEILIVDVGWNPAGDQVVFLVQNREQTWLDLDFADPETGALRTAIHESCTDGWVNRLPMPRWLEDGTFLWESERTGFKHFYRYRPDGQLVATVSHGDWEARRVIRLDEPGGWIVFSGTLPDYAIGENAYRATLDGKSLVRLTKGRGSHTVRLNGDGSLLLDQFSSMANPGELWVRKADGSDVRKVFARELPADAAAAALPQWQQIRARDGETLDVAYTLPRGFDAKGRYPVWISTYSGPDSASVRDTFGRRGGSDWYVGLQVNVRSASGRGMKYTKTCYRQLGVQELRDLEDAVDWLCTNHSWADAARVGITGGSYGGFMTAFALTHSDKFKCGIAVSGVYDWRLYDTIYTERYMATPQHNPEGYAATSVVEGAKNLKGELLILHGTMDDNVHMQNAVQLIDGLQKAGKLNFTLMLYPGSRHGIRSQHLGALREKFMREHL